MNKRALDILLLLTVFGAITQTASASVTLPDSGSTCAMLGFAVVGLAAVRRFLRR